MPSVYLQRMLLQIENWLLELGQKGMGNNHVYLLASQCVGSHLIDRQMGKRANARSLKALLRYGGSEIYIFYVHYISIGTLRKVPCDLALCLSHQPANQSQRIGYCFPSEVVITTLPKACLPFQFEMRTQLQNIRQFSPGYAILMIFLHNGNFPS